MSVMAPPPKPKKVRKSKRKSKKNLNYPGLTPEDLPEFAMEHQKAFEEMQGQCYNELHRPRVVKIQGFADSLYYICQECLEKYLEQHKELKKIVISFGR